MLTDLRSILALAEEKGCAIPAFNCYTQECVMGVLEAAKETGAPVIFQMFSRLADTNDGNFVAPAILEAIRQLPQPAVMHLDHGAGIPEVVRAIRLGMTGVMIDASTLPLEENIAMTKLAAELCSYAGVPVEGELGHVGATKDEVLGNYIKSSPWKPFTIASEKRLFRYGSSPVDSTTRPHLASRTRSTIAEKVT